MITYRALHLSFDVTHELFFASSQVRAFKLLSADGTFIRIRPGPGAASMDVCTDSWSGIQLDADVHGADFIAVLHEQKVLSRNRTPTGRAQWVRTLMVPDARAIGVIDGAVANPHEPRTSEDRKHKRRPPGSERKRRRKARAKAGSRA